MNRNTTSAGYRYGPQWKSTVDRNSGDEDWRAYCEALSCVKKFFRHQHLEGRTEAKVHWQAYLALLEKKRGVESAQRLRADFELIGIHEGAELRAAVEAAAEAEWQNAQPQDAGAPMAA